MQRQLFESFYKHTIETIALEVLKAKATPHKCQKPHYTVGAK